MQGGCGEFPRCAPEPMHGKISAWARLQICAIFTEELLENSALLEFFARTEFSTSNQVGGGWVSSESEIKPSSTSEPLSEPRHAQAPAPIRQKDTIRRVAWRGGMAHHARRSSAELARTLSQQAREQRRDAEDSCLASEREGAALDAENARVSAQVAALREQLKEHARESDADRGVGRLRRGPSAILPPSFSFIWRIPIETTHSSDE